MTPAPGIAARARAALADEQLQDALGNLTGVLSALGRHARQDPRLAALREQAAVIRRETLDDLDGWLARLEERLVGNGAVVHHAATPEDACRVVVELARREGVELVVKAKSMATEEIELNDALPAAGISAVETDLGEFIVQLAGQRPSHIVGPALHLRLPQVAELFGRLAGAELPPDPEVLCAFAREHLRSRFLEAGMGVTGANFAAADTGTIVLVTNEGNGRLCSSVPRLHVVVMPVEKVVPRLADVGVLLPALTTAASGQPLTTYVSMITGPRRPGDVDGPEQLHVVLLDHRRRALLGTRYEEMLACIRCGACLNVCPVYGKIGGHAYDSVYSGPMGAVLTPLLSGGSDGRDLPDASSLCGACTEACPVGIPLADMLVHLRADLRRPSPVTWLRRDGAPAPAPLAARRLGFAAWARTWSSPAGYRATTALVRAGARMLRRLRASGESWLPSLPSVRGWSSAREVPMPATSSFRMRWEARRRGEERW